MKRTPPTNNNRRPRRSAKSASRQRPASRVTILVLAFLMVVLGVQILRMNGQIKNALAEETLVAQRLEELQEANRQLQDDLNNSSDPTLIENIARDQLGMVCPGEKVFHISK